MISLVCQPTFLSSQEPSPDPSLDEETPLELPQLRKPPPKNKGGRPKGIHTKPRPKWLLAELKKRPKRPRGRPKGSKTKPTTLEELILNPPPRRQPRPKKPKADITPEERAQRSAAGRKGAAARANKQRKPPGIPPYTTNHEWAVMLDEAHKIAKRIIKQMDREGSLPDNPIAREAMIAATEMLAVDLPAKDRLAVIRTLLEYNMAKPAATQNLNVKTAEDFLDGIADKD